MERERHTCPVTLLKDKAACNSDDEIEESGPLVTLYTAHMMPFAIDNAEVRSALCNK